MPREGWKPWYRKPPGRPRQYPTVQAICEQCAQEFSFVARACYPKRRFCSDVCRSAFRPMKGQPRKLPAADVVVALYCEKMQPTTQIAKTYGCTPKTVNEMLHRAGVQMRKYGGRSRCSVDGCEEPAFKIKHATNGAMYGTMCAAHREVHRRQFGRKTTTPERMQPWRWKENKTEETLWINKSKTLLKQVRGMVSTLQEQEASQFLAME